jgi:hypothetical protein
MSKPAPTPQHPYPSNYKPGTYWAIDEAWKLLDNLPVGMLPDDYRFLLAGQIAGTLIKYANLAGETGRCKMCDRWYEAATKALCDETTGDLHALVVEHRATNQ